MYKVSCSKCTCCDGRKPLSNTFDSYVIRINIHFSREIINEKINQNTFYLKLKEKKLLTTNMATEDRLLCGQSYTQLIAKVVKKNDPTAFLDPFV